MVGAPVAAVESASWVMDLGAWSRGEEGTVVLVVVAVQHP